MHTKSRGGKYRTMLHLTRGLYWVGRNGSFQVKHSDDTNVHCQHSLCSYY
jgi:hypothetical protein